MAETDCPICQSELGAPAYVKSTEDSEVNEVVFRLKCGHAFHNGCLCRALRTEGHCPVCRSSDRQEFDIQLRVDETGNVVLNMDQEEPNFTSMVTGVVGMVNCMRHIDADAKVQEERARANKAHRIYRKCEIDISKSRKKLIDGALSQLRREKKPLYDKEATKYRRSLRQLREVEIQSAQRFIGGRSDISVEEAEELYKCIEESTSLRSRADNSGSFGPMKSRFWTHY